MTTLNADKSLVDFLRQTKELAEIRDADGTIIGFFAPVAMEDAKHYARAAAHFKPDEIQRRKFSPEEVLARCQGKRHTTREVFEHLLTLCTDDQSRADLERHLREME